LGRAILRSSPEDGSLEEILAEHVPYMFPARSMAIWLFLEDVLYRIPDDWSPDLAVISAWMSGDPGLCYLMPGEALPWAGGEKVVRPIAALPIISQESGQPIGGILLELRILQQTWTAGSVAQLGPVLQSLADQISSHLQNVAEYQRSVELQHVQQELRLAAQIQSSFLPREIPNLPGWTLAVSYQPAGELSGDFFDLIQLSDERLGLVIADVAGKGLGASLYMALCRTLIRTFAMEYPNRPDIVLSETNERILQDASAELFITTFYGVLDLKNSRLSYCNAGHNPAFLFGPEGEAPLDSLQLTGVPIGIETDRKWERREILIEPGGTLLLYSDGITEGQNLQGDEFGLERLQHSAGEYAGKPPNEMQENVLAALNDFVGDAPQFDDITMLVLRRDA
jgi:serine phosphatase RsbU (regulator of sigma subunit)